MKQLKFLKTVTMDGKPMWYKDCIYEVLKEGTNSQGRNLYKLYCEDLAVRGIDSMLNGIFFTVIEKEDNAVKIPEESDKKEKISIESDKAEKTEPKIENIEKKSIDNKPKRNYKKKNTTKK